MWAASLDSYKSLFIHIFCAHTRKLSSPVANCIYFPPSALSNFLTAYCNKQVFHISLFFCCCSLLEATCILYQQGIILPEFILLGHLMTKYDLMDGGIAVGCLSKITYLPFPNRKTCVTFATHFLLFSIVRNYIYISFYRFMKTSWCSLPISK